LLFRFKKKKKNLKKPILILPKLCLSSFVISPKIEKTRSLPFWNKAIILNTKE
jgi:hypothetical protein